VRSKIAIIIALCMLLAAVAAQAQTRTTPVEVVNLIGIDPAANTVKAQQSGLWSVGIQGTLDARLVESPTVKFDTTSNTVKAQQSGMWNVGITGTPTVAQSGAWNVGISGTPNVNVSNSPTVRVDAAHSSVSTPTGYRMVQLFSEDRVVAANGTVTTSFLDCAGYSEMRVVMYSNTTSVDVDVSLWKRSPTNVYLRVGRANFGTSGQSVSNQANFTTTPTFCMFAVPVLSDRVYISVYNGTSQSITIRSHSYVMLVD
jgi:hypothetical protein